MSSQTAKIMRQQLHISHSQIFTYLACSLKYRFQYVERRPAESLSIALLFGKAIHSAIERFYRHLKETGRKIDQQSMMDVFSESLDLNLKLNDVPLLYKSEMADAESAKKMGHGLLEVFWESSDIDSCQIVDVELPLSAELVDEQGALQDINLVGIIDLLLKDRRGNYVVVDFKTAKQSKSQADADSDLQMSAYGFLLTANRYVFPQVDVRGRFDVLRKLKTPKMEYVHTVRSPADIKRFLKVTAAVLNGINSRVFVPCKSWLCANCQYSEACKNW